MSTIEMNCRKPLRSKARSVVPSPIQPSRKTRLAAKAEAEYLHLPMVLVSDIAGMENQPRVPFSKVDPALLTQDEPSAGSSGIRRNASRACRKADIDYSYGNLTETGKAASPNLAPQNIQKAEASRSSSSSLSWRTRLARPTTLLETELHRCRFCEKPFTTSDDAEVHESSCSNSQTGRTGLDESRNQAQFMSFLGMQRTGVNVETSATSDSAPAVVSSGSQTTTKSSAPNERQVRSKRLGAAAYFRNNPGIPINSKRGLNKINELGSGMCEDPQQMVRNYEKFCQPPSRFNMKEDNKTWPTAISKKMKFKSDEHVHEYSFNRAERIMKINEATIGLNPRYFRLLNKMKILRVKVKRMRDSEIAKAMSLRAQTKKPRFILKRCEIRLVDISETAEGQQIISKYNKPSTSNFSSFPAAASSAASALTSSPSAISAPAAPSSAASAPASASSSLAALAPAAASSAASAPEAAASSANRVTRNLRKLRPPTK